MLHIDVYGTLVIAALVLLLGRKMITWVPFLRTFTIPEPVAGGLCIAILLTIVKLSMGVTVEFDDALKDPLMLSFFATIGLSADFASLKRGGKVLFIFTLAVTGLLFIQNAVGVTLAKLLGLNPLLGLLAGSITLSGGHGTGAAWGAVFSQHPYGFQQATEVAMASATFGLVLGGLIGGPVAQYLLKKSGHSLTTTSDDSTPKGFEKPQAARLLTSAILIETVSMIAICLMVGRYLAMVLKGSAFALPTFVCVLFVGVILRNGLSRMGVYQVTERAVSILGNVSLSLFLAMALMSLKLWEIASIALPMLFILLAQASVMILYAIFVTYRVMGKNYDAAVLCAGQCGFSLGATPTAIANMQAVTQRFGPSHIAFLVVPMVGAFFLDLVNVIVIKLFLLLPFFHS